MRTIYYLQTDHPTYDQRHDLYETGVRWDARRKHWFATRKPAVRRALALIPDKNAKVVETKVASLPVIGDFRGGRPRKPRKNQNGHQGLPPGSAYAEKPGEPGSSVPFPVPVGQPFVRTSRGDRRSASDRRGPNRPEAVMCVPMQ